MDADSLTMHARSAPKPEVKAPADAETKAKIALVGAYIERATASVTPWVGSLSRARAAPPGSDECVADSDFGPWYGAGCLATSASGGNLLPDVAEARGSPNWRFVKNWRYVGPFPIQHPRIASWNLPEFVEDPTALYVTDVAALRRSGETNVPETAQVSWQRVEDQIEEGLQRPWTKRTPGAHGSGLTYSGPMNGRSYARTEILSPKAVDLWIAVGSDDYGRVWINDRLVATAMGSPVATGDVFEASERIGWGKASFRKVTNVVIVRCDNEGRFVGARTRVPWEVSSGSR